MALLLIIEDNKDIGENTQEILELDGHIVFIAENGKKGCELAKKHLPDLILCDIRMPEMNGYEVIEEIKKEVKTSTIPFIFFTANSDRKSKQYGIELGADNYLIKPFETTELMEKVHRLLFKVKKLN